jgi:hypothetical protein
LLRTIALGIALAIPVCGRAALILPHAGYDPVIANQ